MQPGAKRRARTNGVVPGSVWDTRIKMDEMEGGIKVFNGDKGNNRDGEEEEEEANVYIRLTRKLSDGIGNKVERRKRKNWKTLDKDPIGLMKEEEDEEIEGEVKDFDDKEIDLPKSEIVGVEGKMIYHINEPQSIEVEKEKKIHPVIDLNKAKPDPVKSQLIQIEDEIVDIGESKASKTKQNIVDLIMWRDISKSAFDLIMWRDISKSACVCGFCTLILLSFSYTKDIDFSLLSAISYLGLVWLALIFLYKSILRRGALEFKERDERHIIGEEEAILALRFILPYINEVIIKIKALFSGDPATTMKMSVLLFVIAKCGSSITVWTLAKLVFFGIFTIPKVLSCYSLQLANYGKLCLERFRDGWESCTQKKVVAALIFTLLWSISSPLARIWAVFMLVVAAILCQRCTINDQQQQQEKEKTVAEQEIKQETSNAGVQGSVKCPPPPKK